MIKLKEKYVVGGDGRPTAVMLDVRAYRRLLRHVEELEDALALDEAVRTAESFRPYSEIRAELKNQIDDSARVVSVYRIRPRGSAYRH